MFDVTDATLRDFVDRLRWVWRHGGQQSWDRLCVVQHGHELWSVVGLFVDCTFRGDWICDDVDGEWAEWYI